MGVLERVTPYREAEDPPTSASRGSGPNGQMARKQRDRNAGKMKRKAYEADMHELQVQLCHLQEWVKQKGLRVIIIFEGRDAAGKGGTIKAITERVSPRVLRVVRFRPLRIARRPRRSCSVTSKDFPPLARSSSSTAAGTTGSASNT